MRKRFISILMVLTLVLSVSMQSIASVGISADKTDIKAGDEIVVSVSLDAALTNVTSFEYWVHFDKDKFEYTGNTKGTTKGYCADEDETVINVAASSKPVERDGEEVVTVSIVDSTSKGITIAPGILRNLKFTAKENLTEEEVQSISVTRGFVTDLTFGRVTMEGSEIDEENSSVSITINKGAGENAPQQEGEDGGQVTRDGNYIVTLKKDTVISKDETAEVSVEVGHSKEDKTAFNAFDITLSYDPAILELATSAADSSDYTVESSGNSVRVYGYGPDKTLGKAFSLSFKGIESGEGKVTFTTAKVDESAYAITNDAPEAAQTNTYVTITVTGDHKVTLPEDYFTGKNSVKDGDDYTFTAKDPHYDYTFTATMGGESVDVTDNGNGTYTIADVTGDVKISATRTPKQYDVELTSGDDIPEGYTVPEKATYKEDYTFELPEGKLPGVEAGYTYSAKITIDGKSYDGYMLNEGIVTIPGDAVTGKIEIKLEKNAVEATEVSIIVEGGGAGEAVGPATVEKGGAASIQITPKQGYSYKVTATVGGTEAEVTAVQDETTGVWTYTVANASGTVVFNVEKTPLTETVITVTEYVKLDGKAMYLVCVAGGLDEGQTFAYDNNVMYSSEKYEAFSWLVIGADKAAVEAEAAEKVTKVAAASETVDYSGDVNVTGKIDINDAQLVYDMYNAGYDSFESVSVRKFLRADLNGSKTLTVEDAAAVVARITE